VAEPASTDPAVPSDNSGNSRGSVSRVNADRSRELALVAAKVIAENMGRKLVVLDMTRLTALFDYHVIATGSSGRQLRSIAEEVERVLEKEHREKRLSIAGLEDSRWIVQDFGTIIVHLFDEDTRAFYSLENLWADASKVDLSGIVPKEALE
jgi:ribosome-associated protein